MKCVILAGGKGSRLSEYTYKIPKPMVKIGKKPILDHIIDYYKFYGVSDFNIWISISSMIFFLVICVSIVTVLLKRGYNIKS